MNTKPDNPPNQTVQELPSRGNRLRLFLLAYIIAALIVAVIDTAIEFATLTYGITDHLSTFCTAFVYLFLFLPWGILPALEWISNLFVTPISLLAHNSYPLPLNIFAWLLTSLSYILLFVIMAAGVRTNQRRTFRVLFLVFISMVILDAGGCVALQYLR